MNIIAIIGGLGLLYMAKRSKQPKLRYFKESEFRGWYPLMNKQLLLALDEFRDKWGNSVIISPASGALGRESKDSSSQHNVLKWGEVRAIDVMPLVKEGNITRGMHAGELQRAYELARSMGVFTGIGLYPDWNPYAGLHLDVRKDRTPNNPALWAGIKTASGQDYVSIFDILRG